MKKVVLQGSKKVVTQKEKPIEFDPEKIYFQIDPQDNRLFQIIFDPVTGTLPYCRIDKSVMVQQQVNLDWKKQYYMTLESLEEYTNLPIYCTDSINYVAMFKHEYEHYNREYAENTKYVQRVKVQIEEVVTYECAEDEILVDNVVSCALLAKQNNTYFQVKKIAYMQYTLQPLFNCFTLFEPDASKGLFTFLEKLLKNNEYEVYQFNSPQECAEWLFKQLNPDAKVIHLGERIPISEGSTIVNKEALETVIDLLARKITCDSDCPSFRRALGSTIIQHEFCGMHLCGSDNCIALRKQVIRQALFRVNQ